MQCILTALREESKPIIQHFGLVNDSSFNFPCYHNNKKNLYLVGVGVGKKNIQSRINNFHHSINENFVQYINVGIAGGKKGITNIGQGYLINKIVDEKSGKAFYPDILIKHNWMENSITTVESPITNGGLKYQKLVDMESSEIFKTCSKLAPIQNIAFLKIISDYMEINEKNSNLNIFDLIDFLVSDIELYLEKFYLLKKFFNQILLKEDINWIKSIKNNLLLTHTQTNQLKKHAKVFRLNNQSKKLPEFNLEKPKSKFNRNIRLQTIFEILTT